MTLNIKPLLHSRTILIFFLFSLFACDSAVDDQQSVIQAKQYLEQNKLREASLELKDALQNNPSNGEARYLLGQLNITIGDMAAAAKEFRKAAQAGWDEGQSRVGQARAQVNFHEFQKVIDDIEIKESYSYNVQADLYGLKAFSQAALGNKESAQRLVVKGKALDADSFQVQKTAIQLQLTDSRSARVDVAPQLKKALSLYENNTELLLLAAFAALQVQDVELAKENFNKVIALEPENLVTFNGRNARLGLARIEVINKDFEQVAALLAPLFKQSPNDPETNYIGGLLSFEQGNYAQAEERLLKVLKIVPDHAKSQLLFGTVNFAQKDYEQASYYIVKYLKQEPGNVGARKLLGRTYILMGQHEEAQAALKDAPDGGDAELLALVGLSQFQSGDAVSGISGLEKAVSVAPESQSIRSELAKAYIAVGETENAINQLNAILADGGNRNQAEILLVTAYLRDQKFDQAINTAFEILERSPDDPAMLSLVGNVFAASGDRAEARKYFTKAREISQDYALATMLLAALEESEENFDKAESLYRSINTKKSRSVDHLLALARLSGKQGDDKAMVQWLEDARQNKNTDIRSRLVLAEYYLQEKQLAEVELLIKEVAEVAPNDSRVLELKGKVLLKQQRYNEALVPLNKLVTREASSTIGRVLLGEAYMRLGQMQDARKQLELALKINEFDFVSLLLLANIEQAEKQFDKALIYSKKAQKIKPEVYMAYEIEGDIHSARKDYGAAEIAFDRAIKLQPSSSLTIKLSGVLVNLGKLEQAKQPLLQWLKVYPEDDKVRQYLGSIYQSLGENTKAIQAFEKVLETQPDNAVALNNLAWLYALNDNPAALGMAERVYRLLPDNPGIQDTYGWVLVKNGQAKKGRQVLEKALKALPDVADVQYHYAVALAKTGESIEAKKRLRQLLQNHKSFTGVEDAQSLLQSMQ